MKRQTIKAGYISAPQYELPMDGGFCLVGESCEDPERIVREREASQSTKNHSTQPELFTLTN